MNEDGIEDICEEYDEAKASMPTLSSGETDAGGSIDLPQLVYDPKLNKLTITNENPAVAQKALAAAFGVSSKDAAILLSSLVVRSVIELKSGCESTANAVLQLIADAKPQDAIEGVIISLIVAAHIHTSKALAAAVNPSLNSDRRNDPLAVPVRLINAQAKLVDALSRYRRKGEQKVVVEHLTVEGGGQALVANVTGSR